MRNDNNLVYIGAHCYERYTLLLDIEVIEQLQKNKQSVSEQINTILRVALKNED